MERADVVVGVFVMVLEAVVGVPAAAAVVVAVSVVVVE